MPDIYLNTPLSDNHKVKILNYVVETIGDPNQEQPEGENKRTIIFEDPDILKARSRACEMALKECERLEAIATGSDDPEAVYEGLKLYCNFRDQKTNAVGDQPKIKRFYLLDGARLNANSKLTPKLEMEYYLLLEAGLTFYSVELVDNNELFFVPLGGLICLPREKNLPDYLE